jgi:hypothetical protein
VPRLSCAIDAVEADTAAPSTTMAIFYFNMFVPFSRWSFILKP